MKHARGSVFAWLKEEEGIGVRQEGISVFPESID